MKRITIISLVFTLILLTGAVQRADAGFLNGTPDSLTLSPGYANDVYYSFEDGVVASVTRANWDIAIHTTVWSATILTNGGSGVNLYTYPNADTTGWNTVDTVGMASWTVMYDSEDNWEDGAFTRNTLGHPDYGWGKYNPINHDVVGDSIYILKALDGTYKKIWIQKKNSSNNRYFIRHANLDGSNDHVVELNINPYTGKNFVYYNLSTDSFIDREPDTATWDILFTKYMAIQPNGTPYPVIGVLSNTAVYANQFYPVGPDFMDYASMPFDSTKSPIGWEWKSFSMNTGTWTVADSTAFFVHTMKDNVYKLVFTKFEGSSTGKIVFTKEPISSGLNDRTDDSGIRVYPNPARDQVTVELEGHDGFASVSLFDLTGKQVLGTEMPVAGGRLTVKLPEGSMTSGLHLLRITAGDRNFTTRLMLY